MNETIRRYVAEHRPATPCLIVDLAQIERNYRDMIAAMPYAEPHYAVKANPAREVVSLLVSLGSSFDAASLVEIQEVMALGAGAERISFGNTMKKQRDIAAAHELGIDLFAFDAEGELEKIAAAAPGARVFCRLVTSGQGAEWPLSRKFGCSDSEARLLLRRAADLGLKPYGLSFHVGSQQTDPAQWDRPIGLCAELFEDLEKDGIHLDMVNLGGGFTARYREDVPPVAAYGEVIWDSLTRHFGNRMPRLFSEPGRGMVGNAGVILSEVVLVARRDGRRWIYLDVGKFGGLAETIDEAIKYPITSDRTGEPEPCVLAGPTCDSADVLYEKTPYFLPDDLQPGDLVEIGATGAYTTSYSAVNFNGFAPLQAHYV